MPGVLPCIDEGSNGGTEPDATSTEPGDSELIDVANQDLAILLSSDSSILEASLFNPSNFEPNGDAYPPLFTDDLNGRIGQLQSFGVASLFNPSNFEPNGDAYPPLFTDDLNGRIGQLQEVPEPMTLASFGAGFICLAWMARRRRKSHSP